MATFSRQDIVDGLERLGQLAESQGIHIKLTVVGGAAMVLGFDARQSTRDVDVIIVAPEEARLVRKLARLVAEERGWPDDWLNDGAKGYMVGVSSGLQLFSAPGIEAQSPSLYQLLAMKLSAWRDDVDISDARKLLNELVALHLAQSEIWRQVEPYLVPGDELTAQYAFQDLWETGNGND